jgi:hypothetical protein
VLSNKPLLISPTDVQRHLEQLNQCAAEISGTETAEQDAELRATAELINAKQLSPAHSATKEFAREEYPSRRTSAAPTSDNEHTSIDLLEIPARRLEMIAVEAQANLYEAWLALKQAQVDALYVTNRQGVITGIITRDTLENYYRL